MSSLYTAQLETLIDRYSELVKEYEEVGKEHAEKKADYQAMEDQEDSLLSTLKEEFTGPNTHKTDCAYRAQKYINFLTTKGRRRVEYYIAQSKLKSIETKIEAMRTIISLRKEELNKFHG